MKKVFFSILVVLLLIGCASPAVSTQSLPFPEAGNSAVELATPVCISLEPTQADIDRTLSFSGKLFETEGWERTYTVGTEKVVVSWYNALIPSVVNIEALIFPCSYEDLDLDATFTLDWWTVTFSNYQSYQYLNGCRNDDGVRLYRFIAIDQEVRYEVRYWVVNDSATRVITAMIVLPENAPQMDEYAYALFPQLQTCE